MAPSAPLQVYNRLDPDSGDPCRFTSKRRFNLDRPIEQKHKGQVSSVFIRYIVDQTGVLQKNWIGEENEVEITCDSPPQFSYTQSQSPICAHTSTTQSSTCTTFSTTELSQPLATVLIANRGAATREPVNQAATITPSPQDPRPVCATSPFTDVASLDTNSTSESNHEALTVETLKATANVLGLMKSPGEEHKERSRKRLRESLEKSPLPDYQVKRSKKWPLQ
jgi:hypothetical protein